jgi:hypothetical protein
LACACATDIAMSTPLFSRVGTRVSRGTHASSNVEQRGSNNAGTTCAPQPAGQQPCQPDPPPRARQQVASAPPGAKHRVSAQCAASAHTSPCLTPFVSARRC